MSVQPDAHGEQKLVAARDAFAAGRDLTVTIAAPDPGEPATPGLLPRDVPGFTGREDELSRLADLSGGGRVVVTAIGGTAGVGKTALAVHAAHRLLGEFPGGHLYADLRGYTEGQDPAEPGEALEVFLRSLGVKAEDIPPGVTERSGLLRQLLGSRRVLMVLDNARTEAQVRPLLPGTGTSLVLVTSRSTLAGLEADERISLDVLSQDEAVTMLAGLGGHRAAADPTAVAEVARLCGRLPLALRIAGQLLATHPTWPVVRLAQLLASEQGRLSRLGAGDLQVRSAFEVSYQQLAPEDARLFRLLGLHPGPDFAPAAAAALAGTDDEAAEHALGRLADAHLIVEDTVGRFGLHDLLRLFARAAAEQADSPDQRAAAEHRLTRHYENLAAFLHSCVNPELRAQAEQAAKPLSSMRQALAVFQSERPSLLAALGLAVARSWDEEVLRLSVSMGDSLRVLRYLDDLLTVEEAGLAAMRRAGNTRGAAAMLVNLGIAHRELRRFDEAVASSQEALVIMREVGDRYGEAGAMANLGLAYRELGRFDEAIASLRESLVIAGEVGYRHGEGETLSNLAMAYQDSRRFDEAIASYQAALVIAVEIGDREAEAHNLNNLGIPYLELRRFEEAIASYQQALAIRRQVGNRHAEAQTLNNLGYAYQESGRPGDAIISCQEALAILRQVGDGEGAIKSLISLGTAYLGLGKPDRAAGCWQEAAAAAREAGDHEAAARMEQLAANAEARRRRWWQRRPGQS